MYAVKANRQYTITEAEKETYRAQGFDILDGTGKVIAQGVGKTVPWSQYEALQKKLEAVEKKLAEAEKKAKAKQD